MGRDTWVVAKNSKNFNVNIYRRGLLVLIVALSLSGLFGILLFYMYVTVPERDFYATNGVIPPILLHAMDTPNMSANALLPPDPPTEKENRFIPQ